MKEDDGDGLDSLAAAEHAPKARFRLTRAGAKRISECDNPRWRDAMLYAEILPPTGLAPARGVLGVTVHVRASNGEERAYRLVSIEELALLGEGCSTESPVGRALLGAAVGDVREVRAPRGAEELEVISLEGDGT